MAEKETDWLARYRPWRRPAEIGFWVVVLALQLLFNSIVSWIDLRRTQPDFPYWQPAVWELTSGLVIGLLIPALVAFERRYPLRWDTLRRHLPLHLLGSVVFCAVHVAGMVALRRLAYAVPGHEYTVGSWTSTFGYEYLKDVRTYLMILLAIWSYRLLLLRLQ